MAEDFGGEPGGILGLLRLVDAHREAIEYELLRAGLRLRDLGTEQFNWRDLFVLVRAWQKQPHNALAEAVHKHPVWTIGEQLLAILVDLTGHGNWQRLKKRFAPKPKRLPRPWEKQNTRQLGSDPIPISQFDDWWDAQS